MWVWYAAGVAVQLSLPDSLPDLENVPLPSIRGGGRTERASLDFTGGDAGGGGASDLFDSPMISSGDDGGGGGFDLDLDLDDGFWILFALAVFVIIIAASGGYLIWMAPEILPEVAIECAIGAGLVRQLKDSQRVGQAGFYTRPGFRWRW